MAYPHMSDRVQFLKGDMWTPTRSGIPFNQWVIDDNLFWHATSFEGRLYPDYLQNVDSMWKWSISDTETTRNDTVTSKYNGNSSLSYTHTQNSDHTSDLNYGDLKSWINSE